MGYACIAATILLTVYGQLILYWRVSGRELFPNGFHLSEMLPVLRMVLDPWILSGFAAAFLASLFYMVGLSKFQISFAYPFMSLTFPLTAIGAFFFFGDALPGKRIVGLALIVCGVVVSGQATGATKSVAEPGVTQEVGK